MHKSDFIFGNMTSFDLASGYSVHPMTRVIPLDIRTKYKNDTQCGFRLYVSLISCIKSWTNRGRGPLLHRWSNCDKMRMTECDLVCVPSEHFALKTG